jgi:hypothetical protein
MPERRVLRQPVSQADVGKSDLIQAGTFRDLSQSISQRSQSLANEQAAIAGQQAALDDPSRPIRSGVTQASRSFSSAFLDTARVTTVSSGQEQLLNIQRDTTENGALGSESLNAYDNLSQGAIEGILDETPVQIRGDVQLALGKINSGNRQNVAQKVQIYNNGVMLAGLDESISSYSAQANTAYIEGDVIEGDNLLQESVLAVDTAVEYGLITPIQGAQQKKDLDFGRKASILNGKLRAAESVGKTEEFLNNFFTNPPEGITDIEHRQLSQSLVQEARFIGSLKGQQQQINYENLSAGISMGSVNSQQEIQEARGEITGAQENKLQNQLLQRNTKVQSEKLSNEQIWNYVNNNSIELANISDGQISQAYLAMLDIKRDEKQQNALDMGFIQEGDVVELSLQEKASIASHIPKKVSPLQNEFKFVAASGTPEQKFEAAQSYRFLVDNNKNVVLDGMDSKSRDYFEAITQVTRTGGISDPIQAIEFVDSIMRVDQNVRNERQEVWKESTRGQTLSDWSTELAGGMGAKTFSLNPFSLFSRPDSSKIPEGAADQFRILVEQSFINTGDHDLAVDSAINQMASTYGPDIIADTGQLVYLPPQITVPGYAENPTFAFNSFANSVKTYTEQFNDGITDIEGNSIKFSPAAKGRSSGAIESAGRGIEKIASAAGSALDLFNPLSALGAQGDGKEQGLSDEEMLLSQRIADEIFVEIDGVERKVVYYSDYETANTPIGEPISYGLGFINDNGQTENLRGPDGGFARWAPDSLDAAERAFRDSDAFKEAQVQKQKEIRNTITIVQGLMGLVPFVGQGLSDGSTQADTSITSAL